MSAPPTGSGARCALAALLLVSGAAALLHEAAWFRLLVPVLGAGALPCAVVAAGALLGLAAGSALGGVLADRAARPARVLALGETVAAAVALVVPAALGALAALPGPLALLAATGVLGVAALPWGVSIPAAVRACEPRGGEVGRAFKRLYAWNTLGAVLGIAAGAAFVFEHLGDRATIGAAAALQALVALGACALPPPAVRRAPRAPREPRPARARLPLVLAAALAGAAGVGAQVAWIRRLTPILGATYPAFSAVLAVHLAAIALGAALLGPRRGDRPRRAIAVLAVAGGAATALTPALLGDVVAAVRTTWWEAYGDALAMLALRVGAAAALVMPGVLAGAALLPWLVRARDPGARHAGRGSGALVAASAGGGAVGGLVVALALIPRLGTAGALLVCAAALLAAGACAGPARMRLHAAAMAAGLVLWPFVQPLPDAAGHETVGALTARMAWRPGDTRTLLARDGRSASVLVREAEGRTEFWIEGSYEVSTGPTDRLHLGLLGHLPLVLWEARSDGAPHVALIGLGGGFTAQAAARHHPASLVVYELEREVVHAAAIFAPSGGGLPAAARLEIADGRRAILAGTAALDVVSSDPVHPALHGSAWLYSAEWFRGALARLTPDGLLVQWLPLYQLHVDDLRLALRTFGASVPYPYLFLAGPDALLVGTRTPLRMSLERLAQALRRDAAAPLRAEGLGTPGRLLGLLALDPEGLRHVAGDGALNTDDRLLLELRSGWREAGDPTAAQALLTGRPADPHLLLEGPGDAMFEADLAAVAPLRDALAAWTRGSSCEAFDGFDALLAREPKNDLARRMRVEAAIACAFTLLDEGAGAEAAVVARAVASGADADAFLRLDAAEILIRTGAVQAGRAIAGPLAAAHDWPRARRLAEGRW